METWIWISLWIVQTIVGAVLWRRLTTNQDANALNCLILSAFMIANILLLLVPLLVFIDYLAGVKNKIEDDNI